MPNLDILRINPHPTRAFFKSNNIPISAVARYLGLSFSYTSNLLSGIHRMTPENDRKLRELVDQLKQSPRDEAA